MKRFVYLMACVVLTACSTTENSSNAGRQGGFNHNPAWPNVQLCESGHVQLKFDVNNIGSVVNIRVIESVPEHLATQQNSTGALAKWRYKPTAVKDLTVQLDYDCGSQMVQYTKPRTGSTQRPSAAINPKIVKAFELYNLGQTQKALQQLLLLTPAIKYDKAFVNKFIGNLYATMDDGIQQAIKHHLLAYNSGELNDKEHAEIVKILGSLYMMTKNHQQAIDKYQEWMAFTGQKDNEIIARIAQAKALMAQE